MQSLENFGSLIQEFAVLTSDVIYKNEVSQERKSPPSLQKLLSLLFQSDHHMMQKNASRFASLLCERLASHIRTMPFTRAIDHIIHQLFRQHIRQIIDPKLEATNGNISVYKEIAESILQIGNSMHSLKESTNEKTIEKKTWEEALSQAIQHTFETLSLPEEIDKKCATYLPLVNLFLLQSFISQELGRNPQTFAPLLYNLITAPVQERNSAVKHLQQHLKTAAQSQFQQFKPEIFYFHAAEDEKGQATFSGLTATDWHTLTQAVITDIEQQILQSKIKGEAFNPQHTSVAEIRKIIQQIFTIDLSHNNPAFGEISMDLMFKVGKFHSEWLVNLLVKNTLSAAITAGVAPYRESYPPIIDMFTSCLRQSFLDPEAIKTLIFIPESNHPDATEAKLAHELKMASCLSYDIMMGLAREHGSLAVFGTRQILSSTADDVNRVITRIYQKLLGNHEANLHFLTQTWKILNAKQSKVLSSEAPASPPQFLPQE